MRRESEGLMTRIFDNIDQELLGALRATLAVSQRADFCVGYLNLRGWQAVDDLVQPWSSVSGQVCRVLVGMQRPPHEEIRELYRTGANSEGTDNATAARLKAQFAAHLREQITLGIPTGKDEAALRTLARQLRAGQVCIKLFLPYPLRQAVPAVPGRPQQSHHGLRGQQQPHDAGLGAARRT
jgi:hypothetical protein